MRIDGVFTVFNILRGLAICIGVVFLSLIPFSGKAFPSTFITGSGCSISNVGYLGALAREYERKTGTKVFVRGGGSVVGIEDLKNGTVDFAASCRGKMSDDPEGIRFIQVAWDALVFIVNKTNPVTDISMDEVRGIYSGKITNWSRLGGRDSPVKLFVSRSRRGLSGVATSVRKLVTYGKNIRAPNVRFVPSSGLAEQLVENTPGGFAITGFSSARKRMVKMLKVNGIYPTRKAIINGKYGFMRPLFLVVPPNPKPEVVRFVSFALSKAGQQFISSQGVVSLLDVKEGRR